MGNYGKEHALPRSKSIIVTHDSSCVSTRFRFRETFVLSVLGV